MSNLPETTIPINGTPMEFVLIPAGSFAMGADAADPHANPCERPQHDVTISRPFYLGKYPVTQAQWEAVMGNNPSHFKGPDRPVEKVSWDDAQEFIFKLNAMKRCGCFRLPTEAEWEYACRAGSTGRYCFGDNPAQLQNYAWYNANSGGQPHPVGQKQPNKWDLYDMHGNVWEWVQDWFAFYASGSVIDPQGPPTGNTRVLRGGSWHDTPVECRSSSRIGNMPTTACKTCGFRVAMTAEQE